MTLPTIPQIDSCFWPGRSLTQGFFSVLSLALANLSRLAVDILFSCFRWSIGKKSVLSNVPGIQHNYALLFFDHVSVGVVQVPVIPAKRVREPFRLRVVAGWQPLDGFVSLWKAM
jgi:hypothetical protein